MRDDSRPINPWWFDVARGAGTDQTAAIQEALDLAASYGGGNVYIPQGLYLISTPLIISSNTRICGAGRGATILRSTGTLPNNPQKGSDVFAVLAAVDESNIVVEHLTVDNFTNAANTNGVIFVPASVVANDYQGAPCTHFTVQDVEVLGTPTHTYQIWSLRGEHVKFVYNFVDGNNTVFPPAVIGQEGIEALGGTDVLIHGNTVRRIGNAAIAVLSAVGVPQTSLNEVRVTANMCSNAQYGVFVTTANDAGGPNDIRQMLLAENQITQMSLDGVRVQTPIAGTTITDLDVLDNQIDTAETGVTLFGVAGETTTHSGIRAAGNKIRNVATTTLGGVTVVYLNDVELDGNEVNDSAFSGLWLQLSPSLAATNNKVGTPIDHGIVVDGCDDLLLARSQVNGHLTAKLGILVANSNRGRVLDSTFNRSVHDEAELIIAASCTRFEMRNNRTLYVNTSALQLCTNSSIYPRNSNDDARHDTYTAIPATAFTGIHGAVASNAANLFPGPITQPTLPRSVAASFAAGWDGGDIVIVGFDQFGRARTATILSNPGSFGLTAEIFAVITSISKTVVGATANTVTIGPGPKIGTRDRINSSGTQALLMQEVAGVPTIVQVTIDATFMSWNGTAVGVNGENWQFIYPSFAND